MAVRNRVCGPTQCGTTVETTRRTKGGYKLDVGRRMLGAGLSCRRSRKAPLGKPTFQPYWGKPAVRNDRGDRGDVGIIRSPPRASILPDSHSRTFVAPVCCGAQWRFNAVGLVRRNRGANCCATYVACCHLPSRVSR